MKRKLSKKILSLLLALIMLFGPMINISYALENNGETLTPITTGELEVPITTIEESEKTIITTGEEYGILEESDTYLQFIPNESKSQEIVPSENFLEVSPVNEEKEIKKELAQPIEKKEDIINLENNVKENSDSKLKPQQTVPESVLSDNRIKNSKPSNEFQTEDVFLKNKIEIPDIMARNFQMNLLQMESGIFTYELIDGGVKITGFVSGMETVNLVIPDTINSQPVISIGDRAFFQKGIENLTLGNNVKVIEQYAFAANNISELTLPDSLETIGINSFRDNLLPSLDTKNVETIETSAFANNQLKDVIFGSIKNIGDTVFINNQLEKVSISESIESFGTSVFAYNDRYVLVETNSPIIVTEKTENGFGHVVNPVTITVRFLDEVSGEQLLNDQVFGNEFTDINGIIVLGEENTYTPPTISGYVPVSTPIVFVPDSVDYVLEVYYRNTSTIPRIELINTPRIEPDGDGSESVLLSFVKATDLNGNDISSNITVEPTSIDTSIPGNHKVTYTVTDELGNTGTRTVDIFVGTDWYDFPLGNGWVLGDFIYDGNKVLGFSDSGLAKVTTEKNLILPHINPADGVTIIDTVGVNHDPTTTSFRRRGLVSVSDFNDNIKVIEARYGNTSSELEPGGFSSNSINYIDLPNLEYAGRDAFKNNNLTSIDFPNLKFLGASAFGYSNISSVNLPKVEIIDVWGLGTNKLTSVNMPRLKETRSAAFINNQISEGYFPSLVKIGPNTFASNRFTEMTKESFPVIEIIGSGAFRSNLITNIDLPTLIRIEDGPNSSNGAFVGNQITTISPGGLQNLEYLGDYTFYNQNISNVPEDALSNLSEIGVSAFYGNNITEITLPIINNIEPGAFIGNPGLPEYDNLVVIWANSDNTHPNRENYIINPLNETVEGPFNEEDFIWDPNDYNRVLGFSTLGREKYEQLDEKEIHFPDRARTVGNYAFRSLQGLKYVSGNYVEKIEHSSFYNNQITDFDFPLLKEVGDSAFGNNNLTNLESNSIIKIGSSAFSNNQIKNINLSEVIEIGISAFTNNFVEELIAPKLETVGTSAFSNHNMTSLDLPSVKTIGNSAFLDEVRPSLKTVNIPQVISIGDKAFYSNAIESINMENVQTIGNSAFDSRTSNNRNLLRSIELPNIKSIGTKAFAYNRITEAYLSLELETLPADTFNLNRSYNATRREVLVFLPNRENPHNLQDGRVNNVLHHIINPTEVMVSYVDEDGNQMAESFREYIINETTYNAINIFGYEVNQSIFTVPDNRLVNEVKFVYRNLDILDKQTYGIEIYQTNEIDTNTNLPKTRYYIGNDMTTNLYVDLTGFDKEITDGKLRVYFDPKYVDESAISIPSASSIKSWTVKDGMLEISLNPISGGFQLIVPINWKFEPNITPDNYQLEINALFYSENEVKSVAKPIYVEGYYNKPALSKTSPLNIPDYDYGAATSATNGPRLMGELTMITLPDNTFTYGVTEAYPVSFGFSVAKLERYVSEFTITDTLPTYIALDENGNEVERLAVFEPELNPNWVLGEDGQTVTQHKQILKTLYPSSNFDPLVLKFPGLKSGYNLVNNATVVLVPDDKGSKESNMTISDDISIYAAYYNPIKYEGDPRFDKEHAKLPRFDGLTSYFYDTPEDRDKIIPYFLRVSSMASQSDLVNVRITDYDLDERLYYYGVSFPKNVVNIPLTIVAYKQLGEKMDPLNDTILQSNEIIMTQGGGVIFNEEIAKSIDYIQIILPEDHKVFSALEFHVDTKLRVPEDSVYTSDPLSNKNIFRNYAVMSGNLYHKGTTEDASIRTDPLLDENGTIISRYTEAWDNLPGNYIWGENAQVNVRGYEAYMGVSKTQTYATNRNVYPGEEGDYILSLDPRTEKNKIGSGRGIIEEELYNFKMVDLLPKGVVPIEIIPTDKFKSSMGAKYEIVDNYNNTGRLAIVFIADALGKGVFDIATIKTMVDPDTEEGNVKNEVFVTFESQVIEKIGTFKSPPGEENDGNEWLYDEVEFRLIKVKELFARKYIKKENDLSWLPTGIITESEEAFDYRLSLINNLETPRSNIDLVDFFPYIGDESIQEENIGNGVRPPRESQFENTFDLNRWVIVPEDYTVKYWNSDSVIDYQGKSADSVIASLTWSDEPAENTRGIRITANEGIELKPNERLDIIIPMKAPVNDITNDFELSGKRAYNTYVRKDNATIRFLEPNRVYNELASPMGTIELIKWGQDELHAPVENQFKLEGAVFEIRDEQGNFIENATSDENGLVKFDNIPINGTYTIKEVKAPDGYTLTNKEITVDYEDFKAAYKDGEFKVVIDDFNSIENFLNVKPVFGSLELEKVNSANESLQYIRFNLKGLDEWNKDINKDYLTNSQGKISVTNLMEGRYQLTEVGNPSDTGFIPVTPIEFEITKENPNIKFTEDNRIVNEEIRLLINKIAVGNDFDLEQSIKNLTDFGRKKLSGYQFIISEKENPESTITTDPTVNGSVTIEGLKINTIYQIIEIRKDGTIYSHNENAYEFQISSTGKVLDINGEPFKQNLINFPNKEKEIQGKVTVIKLDDKGNHLEGAVFGIYKDDLLIKEKTTQIVEGRAVAIFDNLSSGNYTLKEISAPKGHIKSEVIYTFSIPYLINEGMINSPFYELTEDKIVRKFEYTYKNSTFDIEVIKGDEILANVSKEVAEAYILENPNHLIRKTGGNLYSVYKPLEGVEFDLFEVNENREKIGSYKSGIDGKVDFGTFNFKENTIYEIVETKTLEGYKLDSTPIRIDTGYESKVDGFDGMIRRYKNNFPIKGRIIISKYDEDDKVVLAGAKFGLYKIEDLEELIATETSNSSGIVEFRNLELGKYFVKEIEAPEGYQITFQGREVEITKEISSIGIVVNNPKIVEFNIIKKWIGEERDSVTIRVLANGVRAKDINGIEIPDIVLSNENDWNVNVENLPKYNADEEEIVYTIEEDRIDNYTSMVTGNKDSGFTVVNTDKDLLSIGVTKTWNGKKLDSVLVHLLANRQKTGKYVILSEENNWQYVFENLPKTENDIEIIYSVEEEYLDGYDSTITGNMEEGFVITNSEIPEEESGNLIITKDVVNGRDKDEEFEFRVVFKDENDVVLNEYYYYEISNNEGVINTGSILNGQIFKLKDGESIRIKYIPYGTKFEVEEIYSSGYRVVSEGNIGEINSEESIVKFTNIGDNPPPEEEPEDGTLNLNVRKEWVGRPVSQIIVYLVRNGIRTNDFVILSDETGWSYTFKNLPETYNGNRVIYSVEEVRVPGYSTTIIGSVENGFTIINRESPPDTTEYPPKTPDEPPEMPEEPEEYPDNPDITEYPDYPGVPSSPDLPGMPSQPGKPITDTPKTFDPGVIIYVIIATIGIALVATLEKYKKKYK